jgi:hypothetical protein
MIMDSSSTLLNIGLVRRMTIQPHMMISVLRTLGHTIVIRDSYGQLLPKTAFGASCFLYPLSIDYLANEFHFYCLISVGDKTLSELGSYFEVNNLEIYEG